MARACRGVHASRLHPDCIRRRLWRLALPLPRLAIRYVGTHPQRTGSAKSRRSALRIHLAHQDQSRLTEQSMEGKSTYVPKTAFTRWLDTRLPILRLTNDTVTTF